MDSASFFRVFFIAMVLIIDASASASVGFLIGPGIGFAMFAIVAAILLAVITASYVRSQGDET